MNNEDIAISLGLSLRDYLNLIIDECENLQPSHCADDLVYPHEVNMTLNEFRDSTRKELEYCLIKDKARRIDDLYTEINAYKIEQLFIDSNLSSINKCMGLSENLYLLGTISEQILRDYLYKNIKSMTRDIINLIMDNFKIIDIKEIHQLIEKNKRIRMTKPTINRKSTKMKIEF